MQQSLQAHDRPFARFLPVDTRDVHEAGALGFTPRMFVLATLPHSQPKADRFVRVNGRYSLRLEARRSIGLPYGIYPRLILAYLTTQAVRTKNREIGLGRTPGDFARKLGLTPISGKRGTATRLQEELERLLTTELSWRYSKDFHTHESGQGSIVAACPRPSWLTSVLPQRRPTWKPKVILSRDIFQEINRSALPIDLRAVHQLKKSPLAIDIYVWLTYRMSYLRKPTLIPWEGLQSQFGADYARLRDFRRKVLVHLSNILRVYPAVRVAHRDSGLFLYPSPPHVHARSSE